MRRSLGWCASATCVALLLLVVTVPTAADCPDSDGDGVCDDVDNCPFVHNPDQTDTDGDGAGDACDADDDNDGVPDAQDYDPLNPFVCRDVDADTCDDCSSGTDDPANDGADLDADGLCDAGDPDDDNDGVPDVDDVDPMDPYSCGDWDGDTCDDCSVGTDGTGPLADNDPANDGPDFDGDGLCDAGDPDDDDDGIPDAADPCPHDPTNSCVCPDADGDGICDDDDTCTDTDGDGCGDPGFPANTCCADNCPQDYNPDQSDVDTDGIGDICDPCPTDPTNTCDCDDTDLDGICDPDDNCPFMTNPSQEDVDGDGVGDLCDNCPNDPNPDQSDIDLDGLGDVCDPCPDDPNNDCCDDADDDSVCDDVDNCPLVYNPDQTDTDGDGAGDACDADDDNDGVHDAVDADPLDPFVCEDVDGDTCDDCSVGTDGMGPLADNDPANDGPDFDGDGLCDLGDPDDDDDGIPDAADPCPHDPTNTCQCPDVDGDGICDADDNCPFIPNPDQIDMDGDGQGDLCDPCPLDPWDLCNPCPDADADGICDADDNCPFVANPDQSDADGDGIGDACDPCPLDPTNTCVPICTRLPATTESWWPGDGHETDIVGDNSPTGTIGTPVFVPAHVRDGIKFDGQDGYVVPDVLGLNLRTHVPASLAAWIRVDDLPPDGSAAIVDKREGEASSRVGYLLYVTAPDDGRSDMATIRFRMTDGTSAQELASRPFAWGTYHHVAVVVDRYFDTATLYLDGIRQDTQLESVGDLTNGSDFYIGHQSQYVATYVVPFDGVIDELQFFGRAISSCEVRAIHGARTAGACRDDADADRIVDYADNCPWLENRNQANQDFDRAGDLCDCLPLDYDVFWTPGEAGGLVLGADLLKDQLGWSTQAYEAGQATVFTVVRGLLSELPVGSGGSEVCRASALSGTRLVDASIPPATDGYWYVLRASNACGFGTYGFTTEGDERGGPIPDSCPTSETELCYATGGWWDTNACGHYTCGLPQDCDAVIPGCDCGAARNFAPGIGCFDDPGCR